VLPCRYCKTEGHVANDCPNKHCKFCKHGGHTILECPQIKCRDCGENHHHSRCRNVYIVRK
jgi:hypothetical protein